MSLARATKRLVKRPLQAAAAVFGPHRWPRAGGALVVLTYHRILPLGDPRTELEQPGMVVSPETLRMHLQVLKRRLEPVRLLEWIERDREGSIPARNAFAVTFDDGWRDNHEFAFDVLEEEQVPATLFLVSDLVGTSRSFWPERLAHVLTLANTREAWTSAEFAWIKELGFDATATKDRERLDAVIVAAKRYPDAELHQHIDRMFERIGLFESKQGRDLLDWSQVRSMVISGLIDIGSHSRHHTRMVPGLDSAVLEDEIEQSKGVLEGQSGCRVEIFCYPNGDRTPEAEALVRQHYQAACTTTSGWNASGCDPYALRRISVHEDISADRTAFLARVSGWM